MEEKESALAKWTAQTDWMRAQGVLAAQWTADGALVTATLGPKPTEPNHERPHRPSVAEIREEHRRTALGAGSSLVKRVGE